MPSNIHVASNNVTDLHHCALRHVGPGQAFWHHDAVCLVIDPQPDASDELLCMSLNNSEKFHLHMDFQVPPLHLSITAVPYQNRGRTPVPESTLRQPTSDCMVKPQGRRV